MEENKTNPKELSDRDREQIITKLQKNLALMTLQAEIAEARARIQKANLEEVLYTIKMNELKEPPKEAPKSNPLKNADSQAR